MTVQTCPSDHLFRRYFYNSSTAKMILRLPHHVHEFGAKILHDIFSTAACQQDKLVPSKPPYIIGTNDNAIGETENGVIHCIPDFLVSLGADQTLVYGEVIFTHKGGKVEHVYRKRIEEPTVVGVIVIKLEETHQYSAPEEKWTKANDIPQHQWTEYKLTGKADAIVAPLLGRFINPIKNCSISVYFSQDDNVGDGDKDDGDKDGGDEDDGDGYSRYYTVEQVC